MKFSKIRIAVLIFVMAIGMPIFANDITEAKLEYNKAVDLYKIGQYDSAMAGFRKAIDLDPNYIDAYYNLGTILEFLKQDEAALTVFKQIVVRKPTDYEAVYKAANLSQKLGQTDKAKALLALIPSSSTVILDAQKLANSMNTDMQTIKHESNKPPQVEVAAADSNVYENIASPTGITTDKDGNLYIAGYSDNVIYRIAQNGDKVIFLKDNRLNGPIGLISDKNDNIYIANYNANNVLKVDPTGYTTILVSDVIKPYGLHISNGILFISSQGSNAIIRYKL